MPYLSAEKLAAMRLDLSQRLEDVKKDFALTHGVTIDLSAMDRQASAHCDGVGDFLHFACDLWPDTIEHESG